MVFLILSCIIHILSTCLLPYFFPSHPKSGPKAPISGGPQRAKRVMEHPKGGFLKKRQNDHHEQDTVHIPLLMMTRWLGKNVACVFFVRISHVLLQLL